MEKYKKIAYGVGLILAAIGGYLAATFDSDPATTGNLGKTIEGVKTGIEVIKDAEEVKELPDDDVPGTTPEPGPVAPGSGEVSLSSYSAVLALASGPKDEDEPKPEDDDKSDTVVV